MASRRDLLQSFQFAARRVVSAVVMRQTDPREWPFRRLGGAGLATVMLTVVALAGTGVYGMLRPGGKTSWQDGRSVIVDKHTGASYVYVGGILHPTLNFTSAALLAGTTTVVNTAARSLAGVPRGAEVGIAGAPETLPASSDVVAPPWSLCSEQVPDASGTPVSRTRLVVGESPRGGQALGDLGLLVTDTSDHQQYLVWHNTRYPLTDPKDLVALQLQSTPSVSAGDAWLKALPEGQAIAPLHPGAFQQPSRALPGLIVGYVYRVDYANQSSEYYIAGADALIPISQLQAEVEHAAGALVKVLSSTQAADAVAGSLPSRSAASPPTTAPSYVQTSASDSVVCATYTNGSFAPQVLVGSEIPPGDGISTSGTSAAGTVLADRVWIPPGKAAVVESLSSASAGSGPLFLVTGTGKRYAIPDVSVLGNLGLATATISKLPSSLLARIPEGPTLDPAAAGVAAGDGAADAEVTPAPSASAT